MAHCPISHTPISELRTPVVFRHGIHSTVFDAEEIIHWLRSCKLRDPITNKAITADLAINVLMPHRLPHSTDGDMELTTLLLMRSGMLDGKGGQVLEFMFQRLRVIIELGL